MASSIADPGSPHTHQGPSSRGDTSLLEDEYEKANPSLQVAFSTVMDQSDYYKTSSFYKQVKCLLISWDQDSDDLHTGDEVRSSK